MQIVSPLGGLGALPPRSFIDGGTRSAISPAALFVNVSATIAAAAPRAR